MATEKKTEQKAKPAKEKKAEPQKSAKGFYYYIKQIWKKPSEEFTIDQRKRMIDWRASERVTKIEKPLRLDKARAIGYKAKKGFVVLRVTVKRGGHYRSRPASRRRGSKQGVRKVLKMSYQWIAEQRAQNHHKNLEVLNSYPIGADGKFYFYEVIMVDPEAPEIKSDKNINWICKPENRKRALRGLTSAAKKSRGMRTKSRNLKVRPSLRAWGRRGR